MNQWSELDEILCMAIFLVLARVGYQIINELKILLPIPIKMTIQSWFEIPCMHSWFEKDWDCKISEDFNSFIKSFPKSIFICKVAWSLQLKLPNFQNKTTNLLFLSSEQMKWKDLKMIWWKSNQITDCEWQIPINFVVIGNFPLSNPNLGVIGNGRLWNRIWYPTLAKIIIFGILFYMVMNWHPRGHEFRLSYSPRLSFYGTVWSLAINHTILLENLVASTLKLLFLIFEFRILMFRRIGGSCKRLWIGLKAWFYQCLYPRWTFQPIFVM